MAVEREAATKILQNTQAGSKEKETVQDDDPKVEGRFYSESSFLFFSLKTFYANYSRPLFYSGFS